MTTPASALGNNYTDSDLKLFLVYVNIHTQEYIKATTDVHPYIYFSSLLQVLLIIFTDILKRLSFMLLGLSRVFL